MRRRPLAVALLLVVLAACTRPPLRVGASGDYPPFAERLSDGTWRGFDVEVARAYAKDRGRTLQIVPFRWPDLAAALARKDFDVAMSGVTVGAERLIAGRFAATVARTRAVLVARPGAAPPRRVAVNRGGHLERVAAATLPGVTLVPVDDNRALFAPLDDGRADAVVADALEAAPRLAVGGLVVARTLSHDRKAYWMRGDDESLERDLDAWLLERERDGTLPALRARFLGPDAGPRLAPATSWVVDLLGRRLLLMPAIGLAKRASGLPIEDKPREQQVIDRAPEAVRALARAEIEAAKAVQTPPPPPGTPDEQLTALRAAIDRLDGTIAGALAAATPIRDPRDAVLAQLHEDAPLPGATDAVLAPLADALVALPPPAR
jgi:cyclohexadienyl dehydratase